MLREIGSCLAPRVEEEGGGGLGYIVLLFLTEGVVRWSRGGL